MKYILKLCFAAFLISAAVSCTKEDTVQEEKAVKKGMMPYEATISMDATKASLDGNTVVWTVGDKVAIYDGVNSEANEFSVIASKDGSATIRGEISQGAETLWGVFPFSAAAGLENNCLSVNVPSTQEITTGKTVAADALVSVSKAAVGGNLNFKNAVSLVKFTIPVDGIKDVVFSGSTGVTGEMEVEIADPLTFNYTGTSALTVSKEDGFAKNTSYYATVFAQEQSGIKFVFIADDYKSIVSSDKTASFAVSSGLSFPVSEDQINNGKYPINIKNKADLDAFAAHSSLYEAGEWVNLCADIDYDGEWTAVADFKGNFNGGNYSIYGSTKGLTFKANSSYPEYIGFFSQIYAEVKDLKLGYNPSTGAYDGHSDLTYHETIKFAGVLAGAAVASESSGVGPVKITNVQNYIGHHADFTTALASGSTLSAGNLIGILGCPNSEVTSCINYAELGNISALTSVMQYQYLGGLIGTVNGAHNSTITGCTNYGDIKNNTQTDYIVASNYYSGGIVGGRESSTKQLIFVNCISAGDIIDACKNTGKLTYLGGILGTTGSTKAGDYDITMQGCVNKCGTLNLGEQSNTCGAGGMIGYAVANIHLLNCVNGVENDNTVGTIPVGGNCGTSSSCSVGYGGMVGVSNGPGLIEGCTNYAPIAMVSGFSLSVKCPSGFGMGGILGLAKSSSATVSVKNCINYGEITIAYSGSLAFNYGAGAGGVIGNTLGNTPISYCENYGVITQTGVESMAGAGGLVGYYKASKINLTTAPGCKVDCEVTVPNNGHGGMLIGYSQKSSTWGTVDAKIKVRGTFNSTVLTSDNYTQYLYKTTASMTCNTEFW